MNTYYALTQIRVEFVYVLRGVFGVARCFK